MSKKDINKKNGDIKNIETKDQVAPSFGRALKREFSKDRVAKISLILLIIILLGVFIGGTFFVKRPDYMIVNLFRKV